MRGILNDSRERRRLGEREVSHLARKIFFRRGFYAVAAAREVDGIQIKLENALLRHCLFEGDGALYFCQLPLYSYGIFACQIFYQLLRYRRAAVVVSAEKAENSACRALWVNTLVRIEAMIFYRDKGVFHPLRDFVFRYPYSVFRAEKPLVFKLYRRSVCRNGIDFCREILPESKRFYIKLIGNTVFHIKKKCADADERREQNDEQKS